MWEVPPNRLAILSLRLQNGAQEMNTIAWRSRRFVELDILISVPNATDTRTPPKVFLVGRWGKDDVHH
jgi:hypothetical protein